MNQLLRLVLALLVCCALAAGIRVARARLALTEALEAREAPVRHQRSAPPSDPSMEAVVRAAPFRLRRTAAGAAYDPARIGVNALPQPPRAARPVLTLSGIVWGAAPSIVLEGIPGTDGPRVMSRGDTLGGLRVRQIRRNDAVVTGFDTTWVLRVREVW